MERGACERYAIGSADDVRIVVIRLEEPMVRVQHWTGTSHSRGDHHAHDASMDRSRRARQRGDQGRHAREAEPLFMALDAAAEFIPVMNADDLQRALAQVTG
jgi:hypothetical protein